MKKKNYKLILGFRTKNQENHPIPQVVSATARWLLLSLLLRLSFIIITTAVKETQATSRPTVYRYDGIVVVAPS